MRVTELLKAKKQIFSLEFYPPKTEEDSRRLFDTVRAFKNAEPDFVSITNSTGPAPYRTVALSGILKSELGMEMYQSRRKELDEQLGKYTRENALVDLERRLLGETTDHMKELTYADRKAVHNLKYFTWVEQQGKTSAELRRLWDPSFWDETFAMVDEYDRLIDAFNAEAGV